MTLVLVLTDQARHNQYSALLPDFALDFPGPQNIGQSLQKNPDLILVDLVEKNLETIKRLRFSELACPIITVVSGQDISELIVLTKVLKARILGKEELTNRLLALCQEVIKPYQQEELLSPYFLGHSPAIKKFLTQLRQFTGKRSNFFLFGEPGSGKRSLLRFIQANSIYNDRQLLELNLDSFSSADYETHIWTAVRNAYKPVLKATEELSWPLYSILYIKGLERKEILFIISLLEWLYEQKQQPGNEYGPLIQIVVGLESPKMLEAIPKEFFEKYGLLKIPALLERSGDLAEIVGWFIREFNNKYGRKVTGFSLDLWSYLNSSSWSGNIEELRYNLEAVFVAMPPKTMVVGLKDLYLHEVQLFNFARQQSGLFQQNLKKAVQKIKNYI